MITLFDKVTGSYDSFDSSGITDSTASFTKNEFKDWYIKIGSGGLFQITSNDETTLYFSNTLSQVDTYEISFVNRDFLEEIESDFSDTVKIPDSLITKKYNQTNKDISNRVVAYLRPLYGMDTSYYTPKDRFVSDYDPLENILNLEIMQQSYAYYLIYLIFKDLSLDQESHNYFKSEDHFTLFKSTIKDSLSLLQIDFDEDGEADNEEKRNSANTLRITR